MQSSNRPLSPHLTIYRPQMTSLLSIAHRGSGVFLAAAAVLLVVWLTALAAGPQAFATVQGLLGSWLGLAVLAVITLALTYHFCNGIRHLVWDTGRALELPAVYRGGWLVIIGTPVLAAVIWGLGVLGYFGYLGGA